MIGQLLESLPAKEKAEFMRFGFEDLQDFYEKTFSCLAISFLNAVCEEPDMALGQSENVRSSLIRIDESLMDLCAFKEDFERQQSVKPIRKSDRPVEEPTSEKIVNSKNQKDEK